ncbi:MFS transporter [soil metagenome]
MTVPAAGPSRRLVIAMAAIYYGFFLAGAGTGIWAAHIPIVQQRLDLDPAILGIALFAMAIGALIAMPVAGWAIGRFGSRPAAGFVSIAYAVLMAGPIAAPNLPLFFAACFLFGTTLGALDVAINVQASEVEKERGKPTMSSFHGFFSIGGLAGAGLGAGVIALGWGNGGGAAAVALILTGCSVWAAFNYWPRGKVAGAGPRFTLPNRAALALGLLALLSFAAEGAIVDWSALYLATDKASGAVAAAAGFAGFSIAMAIFRLTGDAIVARLGDRRTLIGGGVLVALGITVAVLSPLAALSAVGFAIIGIGAANAVPVVFSEAGRIPGMTANGGMASVVTLGYAGFLTCPPILGFVGREWGLGASLALVGLMGVAIAALGAARPAE